MAEKLEIYRNTVFKSCPNDYSYYSAPEFLSRSAHFIALVAIPLNLFGFFCILFKTPLKMTEMKWCLFNLHLWIFFLDLNYLLLLTPFYFLPVSAYGFVGLLSQIEISGEIQYFVQIVTGGGLAASTLLLFENRHFSIVPFTSVFRIDSRLFRIFLFIFNFCMSCPAIIPVIIYESNTEELKLEMLKILSCPDELFFEKSTFAVQKTKEPINYILSIGIILIILEGSFYVGHCIYHVLRWETSIGGVSAFARKMQRTFFIASCIQTAIPFSVLIIPTYYMSYGMMGVYSNQALVNLLTLIQSLHGTISTISLLFVNKPYRDYIFGLLVVLNRKPFFPSNAIKAIPDPVSLRLS